MSLLEHALPIWIMIVLSGAASASAFFMVFRGHNVIMLPVALSFLWIMLSYVAFQVGIIGSDGRVSMIRSALAVLCANVICGAIVYRRLAANERSRSL